MNGVSIAHREHDEGSDVFFIFHEPDGTEMPIEMDFVRQMARLRKFDLDGFETCWVLGDKFEERGAPMEGIDS